jgi:two-component system cell cycle sensor histidine kinase/response regulator CckA
MREHGKILLCSILIMTVVSVAVTAVAIPILYDEAFEGQRQRLCEIAHFQAQLLASLTAAEFSVDEVKHLLQDAHERFKGFGQSGEFSLAQRQGDVVEYLLHRRHEALIDLPPLPYTALQEKPIGRALAGMSGSMVGTDYRGKLVLAAYEAVPILGWGIVAKVDVSEIRAPFVKAGILAGSVALLLIFCGVGLFFRLCDPLIRRLEASEASTQAILDTAPDGIVTFDGEGTIHTVNHAAARLFGYPAADAIGKPIEWLLPALGPGAVDDSGLNQVLARGVSAVPGAVQETTAYQRDGSTFPADVALSQARLGEGQLFIAIVRDIAQRKRLEAQIRQLQKMQALGTLVGGIAHEFNNVLGVILGYTELALLKLPGSSPVRRYLDDVLAAARRARDLVQHILAFSRQDNGERQRVPLAPLIRQALSLLRASLPATIDIRHAIDDKGGTVLADPAQLHQMLMNLGANAEYAMRKTGGVLDIRLDAVDLDERAASLYPPLTPGPYARLSLQDTGQGMTLDVMERIFEPFFTTKGVGEGSGMGLAVVHGIVTSHAGVITVDSTPGQGTTFVIYLPRLPGVAAVAEAGAEPDLRGKGRILFVDDEESLVRLGQDILSPLGYDVVACTDSRQALELFGAEPESFDLIITDHTMPRMTGEMLAREARRIRADIPIILCSGLGHSINGEKAKEAGIEAFLAKPIDVEDWGITIQRLLARHPT